jgi:hypothetical protein
MKDKAPRSVYRSRQNIWRVAREIVVELKDQWPGTAVTVDLDGVDGEDAYLWISPADHENRDRVALTALELVNSHCARMGLWIVPRVLNQAEEKDESSHRLRLERSEERPFSLGNWPTDSGGSRNALQRD